MNRVDGAARYDIETKDRFNSAFDVSENAMNLVSICQDIWSDGDIILEDWEFCAKFELILICEQFHLRATICSLSERILTRSSLKFRLGWGLCARSLMLIVGLLWILIIAISSTLAFGWLFLIVVWLPLLITLTRVGCLIVIGLAFVLMVTLVARLKIASSIHEWLKIWF